MAQVVLPFRPVAGDPEDVSQIMADFDALLSVVNGGLQDDNIAASAAIAASKIAAIPSQQLAITRSAAPPASPVDGQMWQCIAESTLSMITWLFRYNAASASAYKWVFIGGPPLTNFVPQSESTNNSSFVDLSGPQVTVPR